MTYILEKKRTQITKLVESCVFTGFITVLILVNAVTLGMETNKNLLPEYGPYLHAIDKLILTIFTIEICLKFYAYRWKFFCSGWNLFDLAIVTIAWVPAGGTLSILRALRVLRVLRLVSVVPQMRRVITAMGHSIPGMTSVVGLLSLLFYVASVLATKLFGMHPDPNMQEWFGSIGASAYTLFQIMTLESWSMGVVRPTMELFPWSWVFFLPFIIITSFAVLNFFIGIIVDSMQNAQRLEAEASGVDDNLPVTKKDVRAFTARMEAIQSELTALKVQNKQKAIESHPLKEKEAMED